MQFSHKHTIVFRALAGVNAAFVRVDFAISELIKMCPDWFQFSATLGDQIVPVISYLVNYSNGADALNPIRNFQILKGQPRSHRHLHGVVKIDLV